MTHFSNWLRPEYGGMAALLLLVGGGGARWRALARHPLPWLVLAFVVYAVVQAAYAARVTPEFSFAEHLSFNAKPVRVGVLACAIGAWAAGRPRRVSWLLGLMLAGFVLAALVCTPWSDFHAIVSGALRLRLRYAENIVGEYAAMGLLLLSLYALARPARRRGPATIAVAALLAATGVLLLACLLYAQSRAAWVAAALVPIAAFGCLRDARHPWHRSAGIVLGAATVSVVVALGVGYTLVAHRLAGGESIAAAVAHGDIAELPSGSVTMRLQLYAEAWHAWLAHPLLGIGLRGIQPAIVASGIHAGDYVPPHLHSAYLQAIVGLGAIGAALILATFALLLRELWLARRTGDAGGALWWALLGCLGIFLVVNGSDFLSWHNDYMRAPLELLLGCCFGISLQRRAGHAEARLQPNAAQVADTTPDASLSPGQGAPVPPPMAAYPPANHRDVRRTTGATMRRK